MEQILELSATEIGKKISTEEICPIELMEFYISKIKSNTQSTSIFTKVMADEALKQASGAKVRAKESRRLSLLDGVTVSWKDLFDTKGIATEAGSALLKNRVPNGTATVIKNATKSGIISLAKTHMTELAFSGLGINPITKTPKNSLNSKLAPGGSSSGSAVSVALNLVSGSIGSDTGGSVRVPAAWNNLVGLKTTHGLISLEGVVPLCPKFDSVGPIVKSVDDAANFLSAIKHGEYIKLENNNVKTKKLAVIETVFLDNLDPKINSSFENSIDLLENSGIQIKRIKSSIVSDAMDLSSLIFSPEAYGIWRQVIEKGSDKMYQPILERFRSGQEVSGPDYVEACQNLAILRKEYHSFFLQFDAVLAPTTAILPPEIEILLDNKKFFSMQNLLALRNTRVANLMGLPALTVPTQVDFCGLMITGKPFEEKSLLNIGRNIENIVRK